MRIKEIVDRATQGKLGFRIDETMSGHHAFEPEFGPAEERRPFQFDISWGPDNIREWIDPNNERFLWQELRGTVTVDGLCESVPCAGTLELRYIGEHLLRYTFEFTVEGKRYQYVGEKVNIRPWNLPVSHTTCFGVLTEVSSGRLVSRSICHFRLSTAWSFLSSMRLH